MSFQRNEDVNPDEFRSLTEVFRRAGAPDPESWARSQLAEGIPQLAIFSFAKALWNGVIREDDDQWIDQEIEWARIAHLSGCSPLS